MKVSIVKHLYPKARAPKRSEKDELADGSPELLILKPLRIAKEDFKVEFFFKKHQHTLDGVILSPVHSLTASEGGKLYKMILTDLIAKYGHPEVNHSTNGDASMVNEYHSWVSGSTKISIQYTKFKYVPGILDIDYLHVDLRGEKSL